MNKYISRPNQVSICRKDNCIHANGTNAKMIAKGAAVMLLLIGIASLIRSASN